MFRLTIDTDNDAFGQTDISVRRHVAQRLRQAAAQLEMGDTEGICRDYNGNTVGRWTLDAAPEAEGRTVSAQHTPGPWTVACDSYGKVQHSRKACVFTTVRGEGGERLVQVAQRIQNWDDARLIAAAPEMLEALRTLGTWLVAPDTSDFTLDEMRIVARAVIAKAEGRSL